MRRFGDGLQERFSKEESPVSRAFVMTSLLFCVGPLTILGSLEDGLRGDYGLLALKSALDVVASVSFASALGGLLSAGFVEGIITEQMISATTATGGVLSFGLGLTLLELKEVRGMNMLPALVVPPLLIVASPLWPF